MTSTVSYPVLPGAHSEVFPHWDQRGDIWLKEPLGKIRQTSDLNTKATQTSVVEILGPCSSSEGVCKTMNGQPLNQYFPPQAGITTPNPQTSAGSRELLPSTPFSHIQSSDDTLVKNMAHSPQASDDQIPHDSSQLEAARRDHSNLADTLSKLEALSLRPRTANSDTSYRDLLTPIGPSKRMRSHSNPIELNSSGEKKAQFYSESGTGCSMPLDSVGYCAAPSRASFDFRYPRNDSKDVKTQLNSEAIMDCSMPLDSINYCSPPACPSFDFRCSGPQLRAPFPSKPTTSPTSFSFSLTVQTPGTASVHGADKNGLSKPTISLMEPSISKTKVDQPKPRAQTPDPYEPKDNTHIEPISNERPNSEQCKTTNRDNSPTLDASIRDILLKNLDFEGRVYILKAPEAHRKKFPNIPSLVKVGMTKDLKTRIYNLKEKCGLRDLVQVEDREDRPCKAYWKIEQLVHAELKQFQFKYNCKCKNQKGHETEHQEWFAVDESVALRAVQRWRNFMSQDPYDGNGVLRDRWSDMLMEDTMPKFGAEDLRSDSIGWDEGWKEWLKKGDAKGGHPEAGHGMVNVSCNYVY